MNKYLLNTWDIDKIAFAGFDFYELYIDAIANAHSNAIFVEVGAYQGQSAIFMGKMLQMLNRTDIRFYTIEVDYNNYEKLLANIINCNVKKIVNPINISSISASKIFDDKSLDFVFIDADHAFVNVSLDILAWKPKVKIDGILSGHDYCVDYPGKKAVDKHIGEDNIQLVKSSWITRINE